MGFAVLSPVPMALLLVLITADGWAGYTKTVGNSSFPVVVLVVICCKLLLMTTLQFFKGLCFMCACM